MLNLHITNGKFIMKYNLIVRHLVPRCFTLALPNFYLIDKKDNDQNMYSTRINLFKMKFSHTYIYYKSNEGI